MRNTLNFTKAKEIVANALKKYISESISTETSVLNQNKPELIAKSLKVKDLFEKGFKDENDLKNFVCNYLKNTNHLKSSRYMGHQVAVPHDLAGIPDWIHGTINNPSSLYEMGPAGSTLESFMINWMLSKVGWFKGNDLYEFGRLAKNGSGILTHGGSIANLTALSSARAAIAPEAWDKGNPNDLVVMGPSSSHYSISRALSIMGMGKKAFVPVPVDENEKIIISELEKVFTRTKNQGNRVMALIANACATSTGLFDPIDEMANFCRKHKIWFHVDGAHGSVALLSKKHDHKLNGLKKADSLIWDAHKMLRVPSLCTAVLFKDQKKMWKSFQQKGSYVFHEKDVVGMDSMPFTIECTKSALGTKLFWTFAIEGQQALINFVENSFKQAKDLYSFLKNYDGFHCPYVPESNILCFQYKPEIINNQEQLAIRYDLINSGEFYITSCIFRGKRYLRTVLMNPLTDERDFKALARAIEKKGELILKKRKTKILQ